jgi:Fe-S-cluster containining protein
MTVSSTSPADPPGPHAPDPAGALRADLDDGLRFLHLMAMQTKRDVLELTSRFYALLEELVSRRQLDPVAYDARRARLHAQEEERALTRAHVSVSQAPDKYALTDLPQIDCAARLSLCKARCCTLSFPLSFQDLDERVVQWDYRLPYKIRQRGDGYCVHCSSETRSCGVYAQRPAPCRTYDCRQDTRIWLDFERRIPAPDAEPGSALPAGQNADEP